MMIQRLDEDGKEYVPSRRVIMMISSDESDNSEYKPKRTCEKGKKPDKSKEQNGTTISGENCSESSSSSEEDEGNKPTQNDDAFTSSSTDPVQRRVQPTSFWHQQVSSSADSLDGRFIKATDRLGTLFKEQQKSQYESIVKITEGIESQVKHIEGISSYLAYLERVDKQQDEKNMRQDERYAKSQEELKELKGRLEEREKGKEERDKETAKRLLILEEESKERSRVENLMNEAWGRTIGPAT